MPTMSTDPYESFADWYDFLLTPVLDGARERVARVCRTEGLRTVLDACCGTGRQCAVLRAAGIACVGSDMSEAMLGAARGARSIARPCEVAARRNGAAPCAGKGQGSPALSARSVSSESLMPQATALLRADACRLPFPDDAFDGVVLSLALHEMPEDVRRRALDEAARVAPSVLLVDYRLPERNIDMPAALLAHLVERIVGGEHYRNYRHFMARGAVEGLAHRAGFDVTRRERLFGGAGAVLLARR